MAFEKMSRSWALGRQEFKKELLKSEGLLKDGDFEALRLSAQCDFGHSVTVCSDPIG